MSRGFPATAAQFFCEKLSVDLSAKDHAFSQKTRPGLNFRRKFGETRPFRRLTCKDPS